MPMESCEPEKILVPGGFSKAKSILASFSRSPSGRSVCHNSMARRRELEAMPLRSLNSMSGSREMVSTEPAPNLET
jgi:hypothetical protein